jgi:hypothetical protein
MHTVITPLWTPGLKLALADAREATVPNATTTPAASGQFTPGNLAMRDPLFFSLWSERAAPRMVAPPQSIGTLPRLLAS